jgi:hypothetical protein
MVELKLAFKQKSAPHYVHAGRERIRVRFAENSAFLAVGQRDMLKAERFRRGC